MKKLYTRGTVALLMALPFACDRAIPTDLADQAGSTSSIINNDGTATPTDEEVDVCKVGPAGSTFDFTVAGPAHPHLVTNPSIASGDCVRVAFLGGLQYSVTITELAQAGFVLDSIVVDQLESGVVTTLPAITNDNSATVVAGGIPMSGAVVTFYNSAEPTTGGEGCTPGYWKQSQHFDSWPAPYTPSTLFSDVFDDAFPGMTLLEVASQGGGGLNALGRHTVAALLNSANDDVDYNLTTTQVIDGFNDAYAAGDYGTQKDLLETYNELGCPLN
jgi:hypothetical protein